MDIFKKTIKSKKKVKKKSKNTKIKKNIKLYKYTTLKNGLDYYSFQDTSSKYINIVLNVNTGSCNEIKGFEGLAHFLEHMLFRGNEFLTSQKKIVNKLSKLNCKINGSTSKNNTCYYVKFKNDKHTPLVLKILSCMIFNSFLSCREILLEKKIVDHEKNKNVDDPFVYSSKLAISNNFKNTSYEHLINGDNSDVQEFTRGHLLAFLNSNYLVSKMSLCVHGNIQNVNELNKYVNIHFDKTLTNNLYKPIPNTEEETIYNKYYKKLLDHNTTINKCVKFNKSINYIVNKTLKSSNIHLIFNINTNNPDVYLYLEILSHLLGKGMNSLLFDKLRLKKGLFYSIKCSYKIFNKNRFLIISYQTTEPFEEESINDCLNLLHNIKDIIKSKNVIAMIDTLLKNTIKSPLFYGTNVDETIDILYKIIEVPKKDRKKYIKLNKFISKKYDIQKLSKFCESIFKEENLNITIYGTKLKKINLDFK